MNPAFDFETVRNFIIALLIGALIGIEREKHKKDKAEIGGLRTFIFFSELGAVSAWLSFQVSSPYIFAAAIISISMIVTAGYIYSTKANPETVGLTTEISAIITFFLGAMTILGHAELAVALAVINSALLAFKQPLHRFVAEMDRDDIYAALKLLIATFIILPLLPNKTIDPWQSINPYHLWLLVIFISGLSLTGYVATRLLGHKRGILITALTGGLASSTALTLAFAKQSHAKNLPARGFEYFGGLAVAWLVMIVRVIIEVAVVNPSLLEKALYPFIAIALTTLISLLWFLRKTARTGTASRVEEADIILVNPFSLAPAIKFALIFAVVLLLVGYMQDNYPYQGSYFLAALAGLTDVDAITLSMAEAGKEASYTQIATICILVAIAANTVLKAGVVAVIGGEGLRKPLLGLAIAILLVGTVASYLTF